MPSRAFWRSWVGLYDGQDRRNHEATWRVASSLLPGADALDGGGGCGRVCLLIVLAQTHRDLPLVVGANRDELLDRPAVPMTVLRDVNPRIVGGRDELAGGTWLAVNDAGVVAGLTNRPATKDATKRSRGELPTALASHTSARAAVDALVADLRPSDYNPAWLLVGDRDDLFAVDMTGTDNPTVEALPPGIHILENRALGEPSPKVDHVRSLLEGIEDLDAAQLVDRLQAVLADHHVPEGATPTRAGEGEPIPAEVKAACVHTERYGTRWSGIVTVPASASELPSVRYAEGAPLLLTIPDGPTLALIGHFTHRPSRSEGLRQWPDRCGPFGGIQATEIGVDR